MIYRHDVVRDTEADFLREICKGVETEPRLIPTKAEEMDASSNSKDQARLDIAATGLWSPFERTFLDVRITHPNAPSNRSKTLDRLYHRNEQEKKTKYNQRVLQTEKGSFTPLVYSTSGGMAPECEKHHKRVAQLISMKRNERYADVMNFMRTKLRFALLKSILISLRGVRGKKRSNEDQPISSISFGLIPEEPFYESL